MDVATTVLREPTERAPSAVALLVAPDRVMALQARLGRARGPLALAWLAAIALAAALAARVDTLASTLAKLDRAGQLASMSDRQVAEEAVQAARAFQVAAIAKAVVGPPVALGLACLAIVVLAWFLRARLDGAAVVPVAGASLLPGVVADALDAVTAFRHAAIAPTSVELSPRTLSAIVAAAGHPLGGAAAKLGAALDVFSLWSALILAFGVVAATKAPRARAVVVTLVAWACLRLLTRVALGGS